jgi:hypothetical protein
MNDLQQLIVPASHWEVPAGGGGGGVPPGAAMTPRAKAEATKRVSLENISKECGWRSVYVAG